MSYSGPAIDPIRLHYPYEEKSGDPDWSRLIIEIGDTDRILPDMAFFRGAMIGFREHPSPHWILREVTQTGYPNKASPDLADWYHYLDGLGVGYPSRTLLDFDEFWKRFQDASQHPRVLLDIAARQAFDSLRNL